jgi:hypothetical protein
MTAVSYIARRKESITSNPDLCSEIKKMLKEKTNYPQITFEQIERKIKQKLESQVLFHLLTLN